MEDNAQQPTERPRGCSTRPYPGNDAIGRANNRRRTASMASPRERPSSPIYDSVTRVETLEAAWRSIVAENPQDGVLLRLSEKIVEDADAFIQELSDSLRTATYESHQLNPAAASRTASVGVDDNTRMIDIAFIRDRIVERAVADAIAFEVDLAQSCCSFANRIGIGVDDAIHRLVTLREGGCTYVLRAGIKDFFNVDLDNALDSLPIAAKEPQLLGLIRLLISRQTTRGRRRSHNCGIAQESCLSSLLVNLSLAQFDGAICDAGFGYARFAGDLVLCAPREHDIVDAVHLLNDLTAAQGLELIEEKTTMTTFDDGFCYLGVDFTRSRPSIDQHRDITGAPDPDHVVYVGKDGARLHIAKGRVVVDGSNGLPQMSIPQRAVSRIVLTGNVGLSAGARSWALYNDIDVVCLSRRGSYLGRLAGLRSTVNARRLLAQAEFVEDEGSRLPLAQGIVRAKLRNQIHVLNRIGRRDAGVDLTSICREIRNLMGDIRYAGSTDEVMGIEGAASAAYFTALPALVPEEVAFNGRSRRPPRDLANAALSYCYAILLGECTGALFAAGLEPSLGILHASTDKRPSLSLDLMEEFRPLLVDSTVLALLRTRRLRPEHALASPDNEGGVWLNPEGKKAVVDGYEATMQRHVKGALPGFAGTWRRHIHHEAQLLGRAIMEPDYTWTGVSWR